MTCKKVKKLLPLLAGNDLTEKKTRTVNAHLETCAACHKEAQEIALALLAAKDLARTEALRDWTDTEWRRMLNRVTGIKMEKKKTTWGLVQKPAFVFGLALLVFAAGMFLLNKRLAFKSEELPMSLGRSQWTAQQKPAGQDVLSMTIVSQETGLKIVWFFNKNFEWKENQQ
jgi:hypothetical protein